MTVSTILQPGQLETPAGEIRFLRLPARDNFFKERAARLRQLADGHKLGDFLLFVARIADAQQAELQKFPPLTLPDAEQLALSREHVMPHLPARTWRRDPAWREALRGIAQAVRAEAPEAAQAAIDRLLAANADELERQATALLDGRYQDADLALSPFIVAALQAYWLHMATSLGEAAFGRTEPANLCPVCASAPVASVVRIGPDQGLRYLHCSLCSTEWHMVRSKCSNCESTKGIAYYGIEGDKGAVKAETCEECGSYLKVLYLDKDFNLEPTADDLATLALDILMDEAGSQRSGPNLYLLSA